MYELLIALCIFISRTCTLFNFFKVCYFYLSVIVNEGTSNCFMSTYFIDMLIGFLFTGVSFTVWNFICRNF